uniref:ATP synthase complex subunit 8 n=2 Tax=Gobionellinae TaxID=497220 RepID=M4Q3J2_9GOBI|nr:ATP synthase F0 subunit 8 [Chaeturichthys stigmatias]YP_009229143.1 ATP synthase F0 subunit 8 [Amblychaeturichthys hexanema]AGH15492.1 ATP synthase F0 subunit 8 [Chaeturichthys stigmatias]ALS46758.1 ATP synthase F0 subunit 8 [Amblychaeturichthys hexanema]QDA81964.1 ATP synthase F0 subunit 8 [Chaeturichthys stigmatias]
MPQLNPLPWFSIFIFSWFVFFAIAMPKVKNHTFTGVPCPQDTQTSKHNSWSWPW